MANSL